MGNASTILKNIGKQVQQKQGIDFLFVKDQAEGLAVAEQLLGSLCDEKTLLLGSGGSTPKGLYQSFSQKGQFVVGAFGIVDERYGQPLHAISNEKMIHDTGLFSYFTSRNIPVYPMLTGKSIEETANEYEKTLTELFATFENRIAILGMGVDGHTAGIAPSRPDFKKPIIYARL